jgi:hypothetical protein
MRTYYVEEFPAVQGTDTQFVPTKNGRNITMKNSILFEKHEQFAVDFADGCPAGVINTDQHDIPEMLRQYEYPVSRWPVVISTGFVDVLRRLTTTLPKLLSQIPSLYFNDDLRQIADFYFDGNEMIAEFAMMCHEKNIEVGTRLDLTLTNDGFKVLEINIGSSIGGWQVHTFESIIRSLHAPLADAENSGDFTSRNTQVLYIEFLVDKILEYVSTVEDEVNVFVETGETDETLLKNVSDFFNLLLGKEFKKRGLRGQAYVGSTKTLTAGSDSDILLDSKVMHAVLVFNAAGEEKRISSLMLRPFIIEKVYYPDHIGLVIEKHKANLAILRELAEQGKFSQEENELVLNHIPWTSIVKDTQVIFKGAAYSLLQLLRDNKDQFVIKDARGMQGKDVFIGKFIAAGEWEDVIKHALQTNAFIVQEFSESLDILAPDSNNEWVPHKLIWGAFGFGNTYGGVWVRLSSMKTSKGVINSATGAVEAIVFEAKG